MILAMITYPQNGQKCAKKGFGQVFFIICHILYYFEANNDCMAGLHKQRLVILILCALGAISVFLPWVKEAPSTSYRIGIATAGFSSWGALLSLSGAGFIAFSGDKHEPLTGFMKWAAMILCGIAALFGIYKVLNVLGLGLILLQIASIGGLFAAIYMGDKKAEPKDKNTPPVH
jgi:hypothetical protein